MIPTISTTAGEFVRLAVHATDAAGAHAQAAREVRDADRRIDDVAQVTDQQDGTWVVEFRLAPPVSGRAAGRHR